MSVILQSLTVGVGTVFDAREVMLLVTGESKALAMHHVVEKGYSHMWTASAFQVYSTISLAYFI